MGAFRGGPSSEVEGRVRRDDVLGQVADRGVDAARCGAARGVDPDEAIARADRPAARHGQIQATGDWRRIRSRCRCWRR